MQGTTISLSASDGPASRDAAALPGLIVVFANGAPAVRGLALIGGAIELGRSEEDPDSLSDARISRRHARVNLRDGSFTVTDLASHNGTFADGQRTTVPDTPVRRVIRLGDTLLVPSPDIRPLQRTGVRTIDGLVRGPAMTALLAEVERIAQTGTTLHIRGETGSGKEGVAQAFHRASARAARAMVAVNCATIAESLAERLLFGARRGAFTGAADQVGFVQQADRSTLFLDEVAELDLQVQAKLLRVLESGEVFAVGASTPTRVDFALCSATHKDLHALVERRALREDLYFRIAIPTVVLPPLRDRPEEIPEIIAGVLTRQTPPLTAHVSLIEQGLLRPWPGNVRELRASIAHAAQAARGDGSRVAARHLAPAAGGAFGSDAAEPASAPARSTQSKPVQRIVRTSGEWRARIQDGLRDHDDNIAATARALGMHRTQLRRMMKRFGIAVQHDDEGDEPDGSDIL